MKSRVVANREIDGNEIRLAAQKRFVLETSVSFSVPLQNPYNSKSTS
jgi:hypothetical protein